MNIYTKKDIKANQNIINQKILESLLEAMQDKVETQKFYFDLIKKINNKEDKQIIFQISLDEEKHYKFFLNIYKKMCNKDPNINIIKNKLENYSDLATNFSEIIFKELDNIEFYRRISTCFLDKNTRDTLLEIIIDDQTHAIKLNYLYTKYYNSKL